MVKLVRGQDNVISLHITSTYPVGEVSGTFVAKSVTIPVPQSRNGTEFKFTAADVESIGEDFMIGVMTLKNEANEEVAVVRVPLAVLPEGSDNRGFTDVRITLVSIREVEGGDHGGSGVKMFPTAADFPVPGDVRYIYLAEDSGKMYRWDVTSPDEWKYTEVSGVVHANLAEDNPEKDGYVLNRSTRNLVNEGWDGTHPYVSVANFVPDYDSAKSYLKDEVVFHSWKVEEPDVYDNGIFKCLADGTTVAPPDSSKWAEVDLRNFFHNEIIVSDDGETPTGDEEIWIDETETPDGQSYNDLVDKPQINGHELTGNKTAEQLGLATPSDIPDVLGKLPLRALPPYLHYLAFDDTYPADAAWLYAQLGPSDLGRCSAVRRGGKLWRNYDWTFDNAAEFIVRMSGNATRFASVGVASVGSRLTENDVMSAVNSPYYKCLPGMTLDGINEKGVVCEINVDDGPKDRWHGDAEDEGIHILAAVRWALDHGETAAQAAEWLADHIIQPEGEMNFHFMVADATKTYIVENGFAHDVTDGMKVLTNYALYDDAHAGGGKERYTLLAGGADISAVNFTNAYKSGNDWHSDFESEAQHAAAIEQWAAQGADKESHRGKTTSSGKAWWQSVHTTEYDFAAKTMKVAVQEQNDWYVFAVDQANVDLGPIEAQIAALQDGKADKSTTYTKSETDAKLGEKRDKTNLDITLKTCEGATFTGGDFTIEPYRDDPPGEYSGMCVYLSDGTLIGIPRTEATTNFWHATYYEDITPGHDYFDPPLTYDNFPDGGITFRIVNDSLALVSQLPTDAEKAAWNAKQNALSTQQLDNIADVPNKRPLTDNTCHKTEITDWSYNPPLPSGAYIEWFGSGWGFDIDKTGYQGFVEGDENDTEVFFPADSWTGGYDFTATRSAVCTDGKRFVTEDIAAKQADIFGNDGKPTDTFATDLLGKPVAKTALMIPLEAKSDSFVAEDGHAYAVTMTGTVTITMPTTTAGKAAIFQARFSAAAQQSVQFDTDDVVKFDGADCGIVKAGKDALLSAMWNGEAWDLVWKNEA